MGGVYEIHSAANEMVTHAGTILTSAAADENHAVLLYVVT